MDRRGATVARCAVIALSSFLVVAIRIRDLVYRRQTQERPVSLVGPAVILTVGFAFTGAASGAMYGIDPLNRNCG